MLKFNVITDDIVTIQLMRSNQPSENSVYNSIEFSLNLHSSRYIFLNFGYFSIGCRCIEFGKNNSQLFSTEGLMFTCLKLLTTGSHFFKYKTLTKSILSKYKPNLPPRLRRLPSSSSAAARVDRRTRHWLRAPDQCRIGL